MRCDAWPAERKCVSRGWCGMRPVNATRCIAWAAKRLNGLLSSLLPATDAGAKDNQADQKFAPSSAWARAVAALRGRQRSMDKPATGAKASAQWDREFSQLWDEPFPRQRLRKRPERPTIPLHGATSRGGISAGACGSTRRKRTTVRLSVRCSVRPAIRRTL